MMDTPKRKMRKFDAEFKKNTAKLVIEQGMSRSQVARDLDLSPGQVGNWVKDYQLSGECSFPGKGRLTADQQKLKDLEAENKKLRMERDILKKSTAYFASQGW